MRLRVKIVFYVIFIIWLSTLTYWSRGHMTYAAQEIVLNTDGDLTSNEHTQYWNPHKVGLEESDWSISFTNVTKIFLSSRNEEQGHIAAGMWWTNSFRTNGQKILLDNSDIFVEFDLRVVQIFQQDDTWLRIGLASAFQSTEGDILYTELDLWDSPSIISTITANADGTSLVWGGGDVKEYKLDQICINEWKHYRINLSEWIDLAWKRAAKGGMLESVYMVVESIYGENRVILEIGSLWIKSQKTVNLTEAV